MLPFIRASLQLVFVLGCVCHLKTASSAFAATTDYQLLSERPTAENDSPDYVVFIGTCDRPVLDHGQIDEWKSNFTVGEQVEVSCDDGFRFQQTRSSVTVIVCQSDGSWVDSFGMKEVPKCERIGGCAALPSIDNGFIRYETNGYMPGSVAPVFCYPGFHPYPRSAQPLFICTNDGQWRPFDEFVSLTCTAVEDCPWPTPITDGFFQVISPDGIIVSSDRPKSGTRVAYHCVNGYVMAHNGSAVLTCVDGEWIGHQPVCRQRLTSDRCPYPPEVGHARTLLDNGSYIYDPEMTFAHDTGVIYICDDGFHQQGSSRVTCVSGEWVGQGPKCLAEEGMYCALPPTLLHGDFSLLGGDVGLSSVAGQRYPTGVRAFYYCNNGFRLKEVNFSVLTCSEGTWKGNFTECVRRTACDQPMDIENGNWIIKSFYPDFRIGVTVSYECENGYKAVGATEITCQASGYWSDYGPRCLPLDLYCAQPLPVLHGFYMYKPSHCDFFRVGTEVHHVCRKNFEPNPSSALVQTCLPGGQWSGERPVCIRVSDVTTDSYSLNTNSFIVVISTACGVLGLLLAVMSVVLLKRRFKPNGRLCPPAPGPTSHCGDYSTQHLNDQDREALIPHIDFAPSSIRPALLPTYEEAIMHPRSSSSQSSSPWASSSRHLRSFPALRATGAVTPFLRDQAMTDSSQHRNSITTMASGMTRADNGSIAFGSIDTVNVSDGTSTSVTVDTCDSMASNPSIAMSHRAAAGSIDSASGNEVTSSGDIAAGRRELETVATVSEASSSAERFHGDAGRSHSESAPILEVPDEGKDE